MTNLIRTLDLDAPWKVTQGLGVMVHTSISRIPSSWIVKWWEREKSRQQETSVNPAAGAGGGITGVRKVWVCLLREKEKGSIFPFSLFLLLLLLFLLPSSSSSSPLLPFLTTFNSDCCWKRNSTNARKILLEQVAIFRTTSQEEYLVLFREK